jgi:hypothetical protein
MLPIMGLASRQPTGGSGSAARHDVRDVLAGTSIAGILPFLSSRIAAHPIKPDRNRTCRPRCWQPSRSVTLETILEKCQ